MSLSAVEFPVEVPHHEPPTGEVVHWMAPGPMRLAPAGVVVAVVAGLALGLALAGGLLAARRRGRAAPQ